MCISCLSFLFSSSAKIFRLIIQVLFDFHHPVIELYLIDVVFLSCPQAVLKKGCKITDYPPLVQARIFAFLANRHDRCRSPLFNLSFAIHHPPFFLIHTHFIEHYSLFRLRRFALTSKPAHTVPVAPLYLKRDRHRRVRSKSTTYTYYFQLCLTAFIIFSFFFLSSLFDSYLRYAL